jgi:hypothetical protein
MKKPVATICCLLTLFQASLVAADPGALLKASLAKDPHKHFRADARPASRALADDDTQATGNWLERHPVWAGTIIGFSAGFLLTYAVAASEDRSHQLLTPVAPGGPALVWGGVAAGFGALAGWGIGRSRDKNPDRGGTALTGTK